MNKRIKFSVLVSVLAAALILAVSLSLLCGQYQISAGHIWQMVCSFSGDGQLPLQEEAVFWNIRMPRTLAGILTGGAFAGAGAIMQGLFRNPLADPGMLGVASGASFGAVIAISAGWSAVTIYSLPLCAFCGAALAVLLVVFLGRRQGRVPLLTLLLSGVVIGMMFSALTAAILMFTNEQKIQQYIFWTVGGLDYRRWEHLQLGFLPIVGGLLLACLFSRQLNLLSFGEMTARTTGLAVNKYRLFFLFLGSLVTAAAVCISGTMVFVGLIVPHALRLLLGPDQRQLLPASVLAGAVFVLFCDTLGRVILPGSEIRVGIMTSLAGAPYFLYLLRKIKY